MKIVATTDFKHARKQYVKGARYEGTGRVLNYFVLTGWAVEAAADDPEPFELVSAEDLQADAPTPRGPADEVTLTVQDVSHVPAADIVEVKHG